MAGRFEGLTDVEWLLFENLFPEPPPQPKGGRPPISPRFILNTLLFILFSGSRWCDVPVGAIWATRSTAHRHLGLYEQDGTLDRLKARLLGIAHNEGLIAWVAGAVDGSFSPWEGRGAGGRLRSQGQGSPDPRSGRRTGPDAVGLRHARQRR